MFVLTPLVKQCLCVIIANLSALGTGMGTAWSSPILVKLVDRNSTILPAPITDEEGSWIASVGLFVSIPVSVFCPVLLNRLGRRNTILLSYVTKLVTCIFQVFATEVWHIILARSLEGVSMCLSMVAISTYTSEVADKNIRGTLGSLVQIFMSLGVVLIMTLGPFLSYVILNVVYLVLMILCFLPMLVLPESPYFLYSKGKIEESIKLLNSLRKSEDEINEELQMYEEIAGAKQSSFCQAWRKKNFLKAFGMAVVIGCGSQFTGFNFVALYLQSLLQSTETIEPELGSLVFGFVQLCACTVPAFTTDKMGRKPLLCGMTFIIGVGMAGMGAFFWWKEAGHPISTFLRYLPLSASILINIGYSAGLGSLMFIIIPELFDGPERGLGMTSCVAFIGIGVSIVAKSHSILLATLGSPGTFWMFSCLCVMLCLFIAIVVPETSGKMFNEIQEELKSASNMKDTS